MRTVALALVAGLLLSGCQTLAFYSQAVVGHSALMLARRDADAVVADPRTPPEVAERLRVVGDLLRFAERHLALPVGGRYRSYVELADSAPVWNVVIAPEFDTEPLLHCYPVAGCAPYRGYFSAAAAERYAAPWRADHDVYVAPAAAYSTLGWFADPILSSFLRWNDDALADLLFHELAHSVVYIPGEAAFNESFAAFVGEQGALAWLESSGGNAAAFRERLAAKRAFAAFLAEWRDRLDPLYALPIADAAKRQLKAEALRAMRSAYRANRAALGAGRYDAAMARPWGNARLALAATYDAQQFDFAALLRAAGGDWATFHAMARAGP